MNLAEVNFWPFEPSAASEMRWWEQCFTPGAVEPKLLDPYYWVALTGGMFSGKSMALNFARAALRDQALVVDYPPSAWPHPGSGAPEDHFTAIMRAIAPRLRDLIVASPHLLAETSETQRQFLRWFLSRYIDARADVRLKDSLPKAFEPLLRDVEKVEMYVEQNASERSGQIEDLLLLCARLEKPEILLVVDINGPLRHPDRPAFEALMKNLDLKQHAGLRGMIAFRNPVKKPRYWEELARGRVTFFETKADEPRALELAGRHVAAATAGQVPDVQGLLTPAQFAHLHALVQQEFCQQAPGAWLRLARLALETAAVEGCPFGDAAFEDLILQFYRAYLPLEVDPRLPAGEPLGVARGGRFFKLGELPYAVVCKLAALKPGETADFKTLGIKKDAMHTLASRLRHEIEPCRPADDDSALDSRRLVYLLNHKSHGYWLENYINLSVSEPDLTG